MYENSRVRLLCCAFRFDSVGEHASRAVAERGFQLDRYSRGGEHVALAASEA